MPMVLFLYWQNLRMESSLYGTFNRRDQEEIKESDDRIKAWCQVSLQESSSFLND
jgi:hypothetical protein